jgi:hypothetical protein
MAKYEDFSIGQNVKVIATPGEFYRHDVLTKVDIELGIRTGAIGVVVKHPMKEANGYPKEAPFVYVNLGEQFPHYAFFPEQLEIMETN